MTPRISDDGRWLWDGYRWVPAPQPAPAIQPRVIRRNNVLLVFAVFAATSIFWVPPLVFFGAWAWANFMRGFNGG